MSEPLPSRVIAEVTFVSRGGGLVKNLDGFRKGHHTVPDAANAVTNGFLAKIAEPELAAEAERLFQAARAGLGYKRREATLSRTPGAAQLVTRHFTVEIAYQLEPAAPERYEVTTTLRGLQGADLVQTEEFSALFAAAFSELSFALRRGTRVEQVIDLIEDLDDADGMTVTYPSDCRECTIRVSGVAAEVRCTGAALDLVFPRPGSPRELLTEFATVRSAFAVSQELAGLIG